MNITRPINLFIVAFAVLFVACTGQEKGTEQPTGSADTTAGSAPIFDPVQMAVPPATTAVADPNPAHGQPGHRCEIPVGASLSSAPAPGAAPAVVPSSPVINPAPVTIGPGTAQGTTAPGMNPPHGEPGHDCAVAVGSPLPK